MADAPNAYILNKLKAGRPGQHVTDAEDVAVAAADFDGNLATTDTDVQKIAQKLDDLSVSGISADDARALIADWAEQGDTSTIPSDKLPPAGTANVEGTVADSKEIAAAENLSAAKFRVQGSFHPHVTDADNLSNRPFPGFQWHIFTFPEGAVDGDLWSVAISRTDGLKTRRYDHSSTTWTDWERWDPKAPFPQDYVLHEIDNSSDADGATTHDVELDGHWDAWRGKKVLFTLKDAPAAAKTPNLRFRRGLGDAWTPGTDAVEETFEFASTDHYPGSDMVIEFPRATRPEITTDRIDGGETRYLARFSISASTGLVNLWIARDQSSGYSGSVGDDLSSEWETRGYVRVEFDNDSVTPNTLTFRIRGRDTGETYSVTPAGAELAEVLSFAQAWNTGIAATKGRIVLGVTGASPRTDTEGEGFSYLKAWSKGKVAFGRFPITYHDPDGSGKTLDSAASAEVPGADQAGTLRYLNYDESTTHQWHVEPGYPPPAPSDLVYVRETTTWSVQNAKDAHEKLVIFIGDGQDTLTLPDMAGEPAVDIPFLADCDTDSASLNVVFTGATNPVTTGFTLFNGDEAIVHWTGSYWHYHATQLSSLVRDISGDGKDLRFRRLNTARTSDGFLVPIEQPGFVRPSMERDQSLAPHKGEEFHTEEVQNSAGSENLLVFDFSGPGNQPDRQRLAGETHLWIRIGTSGSFQRRSVTVSIASGEAEVTLGGATLPIALQTYTLAWDEGATHLHPLRPDPDDATAGIPWPEEARELHVAITANAAATTGRALCWEYQFNGVWYVLKPESVVPNAENAISNAVKNQGTGTTSFIFDRPTFRGGDDFQLRMQIFDPDESEPVGAAGSSINYTVEWHRYVTRDPADHKNDVSSLVVPSASGASVPTDVGTASVFLPLARPVRIEELEELAIAYREPSGSTDYDAFITFSKLQLDQLGYEFSLPSSATAQMDAAVFWDSVDRYHGPVLKPSWTWAYTYARRSGSVPAARVVWPVKVGQQLVGLRLIPIHRGVSLLNVKARTTP